MRCVRGHVDSFPGSGDQFLAAEGYLDLAFEHTEHFFKVMSVWWWAAAWRHMHVNQGVAAGGVLTSDEDRVRVADET
jgi:hypothetical protein